MEVLVCQLPGDSVTYLHISLCNSQVWIARVVLRVSVRRFVLDKHTKKRVNYACQLALFTTYILDAQEGEHVSTIFTDDHQKTYPVVVRVH